GWDGWSPTLSLSDFRLLDQNGNVALTLPRVETSVSWQSVVIGEIRLRRLEVNGPQLLVRRDVQGHVHVAGMDMERPVEQEDSAVINWFIKQRQVVIRDGTVVWQDELRNAAPLRLDQVHLLLENSGRRHRFGLTAVPPPALAAPLDVRGELSMPTFNDLHNAQGRVYARLDYADVAAWKMWLPLPFALKSGRGALRGWTEFAEGELRDVTIDLELDDFRATLKPDLPELDLAHLAGRLAWRQQAERADASTRGLELTTRNGTKLTPGDITVRHVAQQGDKPANGEIRSSQLQLEPIIALAQYLPINEKLRVQLGRFAPVGVLDSGSFSWSGDLDAPAAYALRAQFRGLGISAVDAFPGLTRLTGSIEANTHSGTLVFSANGTRLMLPGVFPAPVDFDSVAAQASWKITDQVAVKISRLTFANADTAGSVQGDYKTLANAPGWMDLSGTIARAKVSAIHQYLPLTVSPPVRIWLRDALLAGEASDAHFVVRGNLADFPFANNKAGLFQVTAKATDAALVYASRWPTIENIKADVLFEGSRIEVNAVEATSVGIRLNKVRVE
ncbi:MAG: YhdP family protein, partial [Acidobacteriota bacterium]